MRNPAEYLTAAELVTLGKVACDVETPTAEMTDGEIRMVVRWIAVILTKAEGDILCNRQAVEIMLFVTMSEFPEFYERYELSQEN